MKIRRKLVLYVIASILLTAVPGAVLIYNYAQSQALASAAAQAEHATGGFAEMALQRFTQSEAKLRALARLLEQELTPPAQAHELARFEQLTQRQPDGVWRNRQPGFDGQHEAGLFLPPEAVANDALKVRHLRIKRTLDQFGAAATQPLENVWYLSPQRSEIIFDRAYPNLAFDQSAANDYTQTPWLTETSPQRNPQREFRFTSALFDPVPKVWMVSALYPLYVNGQWLGSLGEDMQLSRVLLARLTQGQVFSGVQHFLLDQQGRFVLAGPWQAQLEATAQAFAPDLSAEPQLAALLQTPLIATPRLLSDALTLQGQRYLAIGLQVQPLGWRYYRLVPVAEIMANTRQLLLALAGMVTLMVLVAGLLIVGTVGSRMTQRIKQLNEVMQGYARNPRLRVAAQRDDVDEIAEAAQVFNRMADDMDRNIAAGQLVEAALTESEALWRFALEGAGDGVWDWNLADGTVQVNRRGKEMLGFAEDEIGRKRAHWKDLIHPDDRAETRDAFKKYMDGASAVYLSEHRLRCQDGHYLWILDRGMVVSRAAGGQPLRMIGTHTDITALKEHQQQLEHIAHFDGLTNLPNRMLLADRLQQGMAQTHRNAQQLAVVYLDLDGFKAVNDLHGHDAGDQLLIAVASRMRHALREGDTLARLGGDEFVAVLPGLFSIAASVPMLNRLLAAAAQPMQVGERVLQVSASLGVTFYPQAEEVDADLLLRQADQAMYQAKQAGKNRYHVFDAEQDRSVRGQFDSVERLRRALDAQEFVLYYQPKVNLRTGAVVGAEALIRWQHPEQGLLAPAAFLSLIEDHPLAVELGEWVIDTALAQMQRWQAEGLELPVSVNVGARQLQQANFAQRLGELLAAHPRVPPARLELEVLETSALQDLTHVSQVMQACCALGVSFAMDDFGTGYSSLTYLKRLPVSVLKIDQSFVHNMLDDPDDLAILEAVMSLARAFGRGLIAEGVESVAHGAMLLQLGCELAQGYAIARPMPTHQLPSWALAWRTDPAWQCQAEVSREDWPLLFAGVEHRAWIAAVSAVLAGQRGAPPALDQHQCHFGQWLDGAGRSRHDTQPALQDIETLHRQMHELAATLLGLAASGPPAQALARLDELLALRDALLGRLQALLPNRRPAFDAGEHPTPSSPEYTT